jgi:hypothetical protein
VADLSGCRVRYRFGGWTGLVVRKLRRPGSWLVLWDAPWGAPDRKGGECQAHEENLEVIRG